MGLGSAHRPLTMVARYRDDDTLEQNNIIFFADHDLDKRHATLGATIHRTDSGSLSPPLVEKE